MVRQSACSVCRRGYLTVIESEGLLKTVERAQFSRTQHESPLAALAHKTRVVGNENHGPIFALLEQFVLATCSKPVVTHGANFIDEKAVEIYGQRYAKSQARAHAGRIVLYWFSQITPQFCKIFQEWDLVIGVYTVHPADKS